MSRTNGQVRTRDHLLAGIAVLSIMACDQGPAGPGAPLTTEEVEALLEAMYSVYTPPSGSQELAPGVNVLDCPFGGEMRLHFSPSDVRTEIAADTFRVTITMVRQYSDCKTLGKGLNFTLGGSLDDSTEMVSIGPLDQPGGVPRSFEQTMTGSVDWALAGRTGVCEVRLIGSMSLDQALNEFVVTTSGTICGLPQERRVVIGVGVT